MITERSVENPHRGSLPDVELASTLCPMVYTRNVGAASVCVGVELVYYRLRTAQSCIATLAPCVASLRLALSTYARRSLCYPDPLQLRIGKHHAQLLAAASSAEGRIRGPATGLQRLHRPSRLSPGMKDDLGLASACDVD